MVERGFVYGGRPSFSRLAAEAQKVTGTTSPTTQTVIDIVLGGTETPSDAIVSALAKALHQKVTTVAGWVGQSRELDEPYDPPDGSGRLTWKQREALDHLIRVMIDSEEQGNGQAAPIGDAGPDPANDNVAQLPVAARTSGPNLRADRERRAEEREVGEESQDPDDA